MTGPGRALPRSGWAARARLALLAIVVLLPASPASGITTVWAWVCVTLPTTFVDTQDDLSELDDDYLKTNTLGAPPNTHGPAGRGVHLVITDNDLASVVQDEWLPDADPACAPTMQFNTAHTFKIEVRSESLVAGNQIQVVDEFGALKIATPHAAWVPTAGQRDVQPNTSKHWNVLVAASWAVHRRNVGLVGHLFKFILAPCPDPESADCCSCMWPDTGDMYINPTPVNQDAHTRRRFVIAHELGHRIAQNKNNGNHTSFADLDPPDGNCDGDLTRKRFTSMAASEGIASYYAAVAFNSTTEPDCEIADRDDFNHDNSTTELDNEWTPSCQGDPSQEDWAAADYLGNECIGWQEDRGTVLDWMRLFWDLDHTWGLSTTKIFDLWNDADPDDWDDDGGGGANDPQERFEVAADPAHQNVQAEWTAAAGLNGVY